MRPCADGDASTRFPSDPRALFLHGGGFDPRPSGHLDDFLRIGIEARTVPQPHGPAEILARVPRTCIGQLPAAEGARDPEVAVCAYPCLSEVRDESCPSCRGVWGCHRRDPVHSAQSLTALCLSAAGVVDRLKPAVIV